jgi:hypothetical protein
MQSEIISNRTQSKPGDSHRNLEKQAGRMQIESAPEERQATRAAFAGAPVAVQRGKTSTGELVAPVAKASANETRSLHVQDGKRVGQVRIGNVMLSLLKKYGITDQEISDVMTAIAQENFQDQELCQC